MVQKNHEQWGRYRGGRAKGWHTHTHTHTHTNIAAASWLVSKYSEKKSQTGWYKISMNECNTARKSGQHRSRTTRWATHQKLRRGTGNAEGNKKETATEPSRLSIQRESECVCERKRRREGENDEKERGGEMGTRKEAIRERERYRYIERSE